MKWSIITDSSCDYEYQGDDEIFFAKVPFVITAGEASFTDDDKLDLPKMLDAMENCPDASHTACPSPASWAEHFEKADNTIAITISSGVSGSYNSACSAKKLVEEKYPDKKIFIVDSRSAGSALTLILLKAVELIKAGKDFETISAELDKYRDSLSTLFVLMSFNNLIKNGRVSRFSGFIAGKLGICGIGTASPEGKIVTKQKTRGTQRIIKDFIKDMKEHCFNGGDVVITHCQNPELANKLSDSIKEMWENAKVLIIHTTGLCSFYAERHGLIMAY